MIEDLRYRKLLLEEKQAFADEFLTAATKYFKDKPVYKDLLESVDTCYNNLVKTTQGIGHPEFAAELVAGDDMRDGGLGGLKSTATRGASRLDPAWQNAGRLVLQAFRKFDEGIAYLPHAQETAVVDNLLNEIDKNPDLKKSITIIQGDIWVQDIRDGQQTVKQALAKRTGSQADKMAESTFEASIPLGESIGKLVRFVNNKLEFESTPELVAFANEINSVITRYKAGLKTRETLHKQAIEDEKKKREGEK